MAMPDRFILAADIPSGVTPRECEKLSELAQGKAVIELGSHFGRSTIALASTAAIVHAVDWHMGDGHAGMNDSLEIFVKTLTRYKVREKIVVHVARFETLFPLLKEKLFDMAFIDAFHEREAVEKDTAAVLPLLKPGATIAFQDYGQPVFGVTPAVDGFVKTFGLKLEVVEHLAFTQLQ